MQPLRIAALFLLFGSVVGAANAQIQVQLKFSRLQYIAYEPLLATVTITNRAGRDIDLNNDAGERWFGFEITGSDGQSIAAEDRKSTRLNSSHSQISYAVFCLKKKKKNTMPPLILHLLALHV